MPVNSGKKMVVSISQTHMLVSSGPIDICKTPAPPAPSPVPIPYPNVAVSATPGPGYTTKTLCLSTPTCTKKSKIALSNGDEPGVAMGILSNRIKGMARPVSASPDVSMEGGNVARTGDQGESNMGSPANDKMANFVLAPGLAQALGITEAEAMDLCKAFCEVQQEYDNGDISGPGCCSRALEQKLNALNNPNILTEQSYLMCSAGAFQLTPSLFDGVSMVMSGFRPFNFVSGLVGRVGATAGGSVPAMAGVRLSRALRHMGWRPSHVCRPDVVLRRPGGETRVFDAKFRWNNGADSLSSTQEADYKEIDSKNKADVLDNDSCGCP